MKPNNEFTTPENRFFYPINHAVEHHESLDTTELPGTVIIPGEDHFVVVSDSDGREYGAELYWGKNNLPVNAVIQGVKGQQRGRSTRQVARHRLDKEEFGIFDEDCSYTPDADDATQIIVQVSLPLFRDNTADPRFDDNGIAILPHGTPLPSFAEAGMNDAEVKYRLLGFINPDDKLVTWHGETSYVTTLVDWCVANQIKQNRLEEALFYYALPYGSHLIGLLDTNEAAQSYLRYYDNKHGTSFLSEEDPRHTGAKSNFGNLTEADDREFRELVRIAHHFMTHPR